MANHPDPQDLPELIQQYIKNLARRIRNRHMRRDVLAELGDHFADALAEAPRDRDREELAASLIADFGDTKLLARLIKRAKKRCRPLWVKFVIRTCQTILVLLVIFAGYTAWFVTGQPTFRIDYWAKFNEFSRPVADESLNAAPHYLRAAELFVKAEDIDPTIVNIAEHPGCPLESNERPALDKWLQTNQPALEQLRLGTAKPHCWFHYELGRHDSQPEPGLVFRPSPKPLFSLLLPAIQQFRQMTFALCWQMHFAAEKADWDSVIADLRSANNLARHLMQCPTLIEQLVGIAVGKQANQQLIHLLRSYRLPPSTLQRLAQSLPPDYPIISMDGESLFHMDAIQWVFTDNGSGDGHIIPGQWLQSCQGEDVEHAELELVMFVAGSMIHSSRRETVRLFEQWKQRARQYCSATPYQNHVSGYSLNAWADKTAKENPRNFLFKMFIPSLEKASWLSYAGQVEHQAAQTIVALLRYKTDHGQFPDRLDKLVPQYLKTLPQDPFGPGPLTYKRQGDDFLLYSFGFDFRDNGGKRGHRMEQDVDTVFWPPEPVERPD